MTTPGEDRDEAGTPKELYDFICTKLLPEKQFTLDVAASAENTKCDKYFTKKDNGLVQPWDGEYVWCNPPYSNIQGWLEKIWAEVTHTCIAVTVLLRADTGTNWFHEFGPKAQQVIFLTPRVNFIAPSGVVYKGNNIGSVLMVFTGQVNTSHHYLRWKETK